MIGISAYVGIGHSLDEIASFIEMSAEMGCRKLFTSLQQPESDPEQVLREFPELAALAAKRGIEVDADIAPKTFEKLGISDKMDMKAVKSLGVDVARLDHGYSAEEVATLSKNTDGVVVEINSTDPMVNRRDLDMLAEKGTDFTAMRACHNYYPKAFTGLPLEVVAATNALLHEYGMTTGAFAASRYHHRVGVGEGLPTAESHRYCDPAVAVKELYILGTDTVYFGDDFVAQGELLSALAVSKDVLELRVELLPGAETVRNWLQEQDKMTTRGNYVPRWLFEEKRTQHPEKTVRYGKRFPGELEPFNNIARRRGDITIDNKLYGRYAGEINIVKDDLPADSKVNVLGRVPEEERILIDYIDRQTSYRLVPKA